MKTAREYLCDALGIDDRRLGELLQNEYRPPQPYLPDILKAITKYGHDIREEAAKTAFDYLGNTTQGQSVAERIRKLPLGD